MDEVTPQWVAVSDYQPVRQGWKTSSSVRALPALELKVEPDSDGIPEAAEPDVAVPEQLPSLAQPFPLPVSALPDGDGLPLSLPAVAVMTAVRNSPLRVNGLRTELGLGSNFPLAPVASADAAAVWQPVPEPLPLPVQSLRPVLPGLDRPQLESTGSVVPKTNPAAVWDDSTQQSVRPVATQARKPVLPAMAQDLIRPAGPLAGVAILDRKPLQLFPVAVDLPAQAVAVGALCAGSGNSQTEPAISLVSSARLAEPFGGAAATAEQKPIGLPLVAADLPAEAIGVGALRNGLQTARVEPAASLELALPKLPDAGLSVLDGPGSSKQHEAASPHNGVGAFALALVDAATKSMDKGLSLEGAASLAALTKPVLSAFQMAIRESSQPVPSSIGQRVPADIPTGTPQVHSEIGVQPHLALASFADPATVVPPAEAVQAPPDRAPVPVHETAAIMQLPDAQLECSTPVLPAKEETIRLDFHLQRGRTSPAGDPRWETLQVESRRPAFSLEVWPARFEDVVLREWRRNHPSVRAPKIPEHDNVIPFSRRERLATHFRLHARRYIGSIAASLVLGSFLWFNASRAKVDNWVSQDQSWISQAIASRAAQEYEDNFESGMSLWQGGTHWARSWTYNPDGYVQTGRLALYRPSMRLTDYHMEFLAEIERKSLGWVFRAKDTQNYYAMKFTITQPGPRPMISVVRYPVIHGKKGPRSEVPLRIMYHNHTPYRVAVDVKGDQFRTSIEGQVVDVWSDDSLKKGGMGFFSEKGEEARVYWVKVSHNTDLLGRFCSFLSKHKNRGSGHVTTDETENPAVSRVENQAENEVMNHWNLQGGESEVPQVLAFGSMADAAEAELKNEKRLNRALSRAVALHLEGKFKEALKELKRGVDTGEEQPAIFSAMGHLQYEMQDFQDAAQSYRRVTELQPAHRTAHFNLAVCLGKAGKWDEAASAFQQAIEIDPKRVESHLGLGTCLVHLGQAQEALDSFNRYVMRYPDKEEALFGKAVALQQAGRLDEASDFYERVLASNPKSEDALTNMIAVGLARQDYDTVRKYAEALLEISPEAQAGLEGVAAAAFGSGDYLKAAQYSRSLVEVVPERYENWFNLGVAYQKMGNLPNAVQAYSRAVEIKPDSAEAQLNLGVVSQESGDLGAARAAYERALKLDPNLPGVIWNLALILEQQGERAEAEKLYAKLPEKHPEWEDASFRLGYLRLLRGEYRGSAEAFEACLKKRPDWTEARLNAGIAYWRLGESAAARRSFDAVLAANPNSADAVRGLAALALEKEDYEHGLELHQKLIELGDRSPELFYNAGLIYQKRGQLEDASVLYQEALKENPNFAEALLNLGHTLMTKGQEEEARSCWRRAVTSKPELAQNYFEPAQA